MIGCFKQHNIIFHLRISIYIFLTSLRAWPILRILIAKVQFSELQIQLHLMLLNPLFQFFIYIVVEIWIFSNTVEVLHIHVL